MKQFIFVLVALLVCAVTQPVHASAQTDAEYHRQLLIAVVERLQTIIADRSVASDSGARVAGAQSSAVPAPFLTIFSDGTRMTQQLVLNRETAQVKCTQYLRTADRAQRHECVHAGTLIFNE